MMTEDDIAAIIKAAMPDADVAVFDTTGTQDHFRLFVSSKAFEGKNLIERHQWVYQILDAPLKDGRLHALEIKTDVPSE